MSFIVTLVNDYKSDHLKAVSDDGVHGKANCQFPKVWHGTSREDFRNEGKMFEVRGLEWTGKFYRVRPTDIIKEITVEPLEEPEVVTQQVEEEPIESQTVDLSFFGEKYDDDMGDYFKLLG